ncbi:FtsB family cell division protein [Clostridium sp.]|uniref:FtsB family cell division protein n=1 Tax=Clostridium sp. TaxID=1506 RepID=UPI003F3A9201
MKKRLSLKNVIIILLFAVFILSYIRQGLTMKRIQADIESNQNQLEELKDKNTRLEAELKKAESDEYLEKLARERLGMVKDGEQVVNPKKQN